MFMLPFLTSGLEAGGRPVSGGQFLSWNRKGNMLEFSMYLRFCCSPTASPQRVLVVGGGKVTGEGRSLIISNI